MPDVQCLNELCCEREEERVRASYLRPVLKQAMQHQLPSTASNRVRTYSSLTNLSSFQNHLFEDQMIRHWNSHFSYCCYTLPGMSACMIKLSRQTSYDTIFKSCKEVPKRSVASECLTLGQRADLFSHNLITLVY